MAPPIISSLGQVAAGSTPVYTAQIVNEAGEGIPAADLASVTLSIVDSLTGSIVNGCDRANILNTGRGTVDVHGNLTVLLLAGDTSVDDVPGASQVQRSLVIDFAYNAGSSIGRHQANFIVLALAGP